MNLFPEETAAPTPAPLQKVWNRFEFSFADSLDRALVTVTAFTWADAIKSLFAPTGPLKFLEASGPWIGAVLVTVLAVVLMAYFQQRKRALDNKR